MEKGGWSHRIIKINILQRLAADTTTIFQDPKGWPIYFKLVKQNQAVA